jgi:hypothetical protein
MYACIPEIERGFFGRVCAPSNASANFRDPPPLPTICELTHASHTIAAGHFEDW